MQSRQISIVMRRKERANAEPDMNCTRKTMLPDNNVVHQHKHQPNQAEQVEQAVSNERPPGQVQNLRRNQAIHERKADVNATIK